MIRRDSAVSSLIFLVIAIAFIIIAVPMLREYFAPKPPIEVTYSLDPSTIKENERSKLTLSIKNLDLKTHKIKFVFDTSPRISIYAGTEQLLQDNTYTFTLEAADPSEERVFTVTGSLDEKVSSSEYPIIFKVYVNGSELAKTWKDQFLTVKKS